MDRLGIELIEVVFLKRNLLLKVPNDLSQLPYTSTDYSNFF